MIKNNEIGRQTYDKDPLYSMTFSDKQIIWANAFVYVTYTVSRNNYR